MTLEYSLHELSDGEPNNKLLLKNVGRDQVEERLHQIIRNHKGPDRYIHDDGTRGPWIIRPVTQQRVHRNVGDLRAGQHLVLQTKPLGIHRRWSVVASLRPVREDVVTWLRWGVQHTAEIHYAEIRPIPVNDAPGHLPLTTDCSGFVTLCFKWGGAADPSGFGYDGAGSSYTMDAHNPNIAARDAQLADLAIFENPGHVAAVVETGPDPLLVSHGGESGPLAIRFSAEMHYHSSGHFVRVTP